MKMRMKGFFNGFEYIVYVAVEFCEKINGGFHNATVNCCVHYNIISTVICCGPQSTAAINVAHLYLNFAVTVFAAGPTIIGAIK